MQQVAEAFPFLADAVFDRHGQRIDEHFIGIDRGTPHFRNAPDIAVIAIQVRVKE